MTAHPDQPIVSAPRVLAIVPLVMAAAWVDDALFGARRFVADATWSAAASGIAAAVVGIPLAFWASSGPHRRVWSFLALGAAGALAVAVVLLATGFVGQMVNSHAAGNRLIRGVHSPVGYAVWVFARRASVPLGGVVPWPVFLAWTGHAVAVGVVSAASFWWIAGRSRAA